MPTPYAEYVACQDPLVVMIDTHARYQALCARLTPALWQSPWAPGKWTRHQVLVHVTQWELLFSSRVRMALAIPDYVVQPMAQDPLMLVEGPLIDVSTASAAFDGVRAMNIALVRGLTPELRATVVTHPERGTIDINDLIVTLAGHGKHHLAQIEE